MVVGSAFLIAGGQPAELFEPIVAALDDVAALVGCRVEGGRAARMVSTAFPLVPPLGETVPNAARP